MNDLFTELSKKYELYFMKALLLERNYDDLMTLKDQSTAASDFVLKERLIYRLHDDKQFLLVEIEAMKQEIILRATRMHEFCLRDFEETRKIEFFSAQ